MGEYIRLTGSSKAARFSTREGPGTSGTTLSNEASTSKVVHSNESHIDFILIQGYLLNMGETNSIIVLSNMVS